MNQVKAYIQYEPGLITPKVKFTDEGTAEFLRNYIHERVTYMKEFVFVARVLMVLRRQA